MIGTLKASGHEVTLIINIGSNRPSAPQQLNNGAKTALDQEEGRQVDQTQCDGHEEKVMKRVGQSQEELYDGSRPSLTNQNQDLPMGNILSMDYYDSRSSSQDTLDDIDGCSDSFQEDGTFCSLEPVWNKMRKPLDLTRTSSAPVSSFFSEVEQEGLEVSTDSTSTMGTQMEYVRELTFGSAAPTGGSLEALPRSNEAAMTRPSLKASRFKLRTSSDGTMNVPKLVEVHGKLELS